MNAFLRTSQVLGYLPVQSADISSRHFKVQADSLWTGLAALQIALPFYEFFYHYMNPPFANADSGLSSQILSTIATFTIFGSVATIRVVSFACASQTVKFVRTLYRIQNLVGLTCTHQLRSTAFFSVVLTMCLIDLGRKLVMQVGDAVATGGMTFTFALSLLEKIVKLVSLWTALPFAISFVAVPGFHFLSVYQQISCKIHNHLVGTHGAEINVGSSTRRHGDDRDGVKDVELMRIYGLFRKAHVQFKKLASIYSVCVVGQTFFGMIQILSMMTQAELIQHRYWYIYLAFLTHVSYVLLLSYAGSIFCSEVRSLCS